MDDPASGDESATVASAGPSAFRYEQHSRTHAILSGALRPVRVVDQYPRGTRVARVNAAVGVRVTRAVGTMACAYVFCILALISLPSAIRSGSVLIIISWIAQTFLQLVLLSIIMVGQNVQAQASDARAENTYRDAEAILHEAAEIERHLAHQDARLAELARRIDALGRVPGQ